MTGVTIPGSVTKIGSYAFYGTSLSDVYYIGTEDQWAAVSVGTNNDPLINATLHTVCLHRFGGWITGLSPACDMDGYQYRVCEVCQYQEVESIPSTGHSYTITQIIPPTCTEQGCTIYTCAVCAYSYKENYVPAVQHNWQAGSCADCGYTPAGVVITDQPSDVLAYSGEKVVITVGVQGDGLTYAWYYANKGTDTFTYTGTFKSNSYSVTMNATRAGRRVYCVITDKYGNSVTTNTVTLDMKTPLRVTKMPVSVTVAPGAKALVTVGAQGDGLTYKWYYADAGSDSFKLTTAFGSNTYSVSMSSKRAGRRVYCVITDQYGNSVTTNIVTLSMS